MELCLYTFSIKAHILQTIKYKRENKDNVEKSNCDLKSQFAGIRTKMLNTRATARVVSQIGLKLV